MKMELLAPAGSVEGLKAVIAAGCDAVYIGASRFGARAYADNPDEDSLEDAIDYAHLRGVKVYLTVNTLFKEAELSELPAFLTPYVKHGVDGVLVQDFGALKVLRQAFPDLVLHASTQMTVTGPAFSRMLKEYGVTRIVPARELSFNELKKMKDESGLEVEVFVHGALCYCYSGQCLMSSMLGGRSGNRGRCAQPCRLEYQTVDGAGKISGKREFLSPKDLCGLKNLGRFAETGMDSLKIEGRMKQPEYAAGVVSLYRRNLDLMYAGKPYGGEEDQRLLMELYNRDGFTDGYFSRHNGKDMIAFGRKSLSESEQDRRAELYASMHKAYMDREKKVEIEGLAVVMSGTPMYFTVNCGDVYVTVEGETAEKAAKQPMSAERIKAQLQKAGTTDFVFKDIEVTTDEESFVPVKALNALKREALGQLKERLLEPYYKRYRIADIAGDGAAPKGKPEGRRAYLTAVASTKAQLESILKAGRTGMVIAESSLLMTDPDGRVLENENTALNIAREFIEKAHNAGMTAGIALPTVVREGFGEPFSSRAGELIEWGLDRLLVRSNESLAELCEAGFADHVIADANLYAWNSQAIRFLEENGVNWNTAPVEANRKELMGRDNSASGVYVYGRMPLMTTANCLRKSGSGCTKRPGLMELKDRYGVKFPVKCDCVFCYNIIWNSVPTVLISELDVLKRAGFGELRLMFTTESGEETGRIIESFDAALHGKNVGSWGEHTKGHFLRGVE